MKKVILTGSSSFIGFVLLSAAWAAPIFTESLNIGYRSVGDQTVPDSQAISGKITSLEKDSFTLMESSERASKLGQLKEQGYSVRVMSFKIDEHTTVRGRLRVGAKAEVIYRADNGTNIAISVVTL
jgi:hypothetical protein